VGCFFRRSLDRQSPISSGVGFMPWGDLRFAIGNLPLQEFHPIPVSGEQRSMMRRDLSLQSAAQLRDLVSQPPLG